MKKTLCLFLFLSFLMSLTFGQSAVMKRYVRNQQRVSQTTFMQGFPYDAYLKEVAFTDFKTLQKDRYYLYQRRGDGDKFLYHLGDYFIRNYPVSSSDLETKIEIGEMYLSKKRGINSRTNEIYRIIGYFILGKASHYIKSGIQNGTLSASDPSINQAIQRLANSKVYVSVETSTVTKIISNAQQGNFTYIVDRVYLKLASYLGKGGCYVWMALMGMACLFLLPKRTRKFSLILILCTNVGAGGIYAAKRVWQSHSDGSDSGLQTTPLRAARYMLSQDNVYYPTKNGDMGMMVLAIQDDNRRPIGHAIWMLRPQMKANYLAYQDVYQKYERIRRNQKVVLATTGGFTNTHRQPEGLTVENGTIVNAVIMPDRHGLVIVERSGGMRVLNLTRDKIRLPSRRGETKEIDNPLHNLIAYSDLLTWCKDHKATLFQTQLLAYGNKLLIEPSKSPNQMRERRILVGFTDKQSKTLHHAIFHITEPHNLADIAEEVFMMVGNRNKKIEFMLNLDVGTYDILQVQDSRGRKLSHVQGTKSIQTATNLIVWTYR